MPMYCIIQDKLVLGTAISTNPECSGYNNLVYLGHTTKRTYGYQKHKQEHKDLVYVWLGTHLLYSKQGNIYQNNLCQRRDSRVKIEAIKNTIELLKENPQDSEVYRKQLVDLITLYRETIEYNERHTENIKEKPIKIDFLSIENLISGGIPPGIYIIIVGKT